MKIQIMMIGVMLAVLFLINNQANNAGKNNLSPPSLIVEAIVHYYPPASAEGAEVLLKSGNRSDEYQSGAFEIGKKIEPSTGQERYVINTDHF
ncbi:MULTISPECIES: hypothetical protein [Methylomicrobium]|uniref:Uncharacterized protein n=1 Tax=Methylomicrobium album BG8 TaxID=686340 RepID=H8GNC1_METAL|nr:MULTISPECIES: hypothetical protein [Methylomicrobium]EIC28350.1 hypothetical protein Metal_0499 [Methylomicrobium album BG8]